VIEDPERCYQAAKSKDARFDGWFFIGVTSTGIYCRPSCPARTPMRQNVRFYPTAAAAQKGGFRACLRCRPDAAPGSPEWNLRADVVARAMRLIRDGVVDREGIEGLATRLGYSTRQINRLITAEVGTGPLALARAQRSQSARILLEATDLPVAQVAFAAGFSSVRQCNDTMSQIFADTPSGLRSRAGKAASRRGPMVGAQGVRLRLPARRPCDPHSVLTFLGLRAVPGVESFDGQSYHRSLRLPHGHAVVGLRAGPETASGPVFVEADLRLSDLRDLTTAVSRCRQLLDLDADPVAVLETLGTCPSIGPIVTARPGLRVAGAVDGFELAVRAVIGQQVSVAGARTIAGRLVASAGDLLASADGEVTHLFPSPAALLDLAEAQPETFPMPSTRRRALAALARAVLEGVITIDAGTDPAELRDSLLALPGIGPWTVEYVAMRAARDPDAFMPTDLGLLRAARSIGCATGPADLAKASERWRPWRSYAAIHLWSSSPLATPSDSLLKGRTAA
jgi:AraC family transcriptional regulator of adaptative response / DNA-3-methyladenine glycosylase II